MPTGKELKFSFVLDETSFQRVKRAFTELTVEAQKFAKALQGTGGGQIGGAGLFGGVNVGRPPTAAGTLTAAAPKSSQVGFSQVIMENANAFRNLAGVGKASMAALGDSLKRAIREQQDEIGRLDRVLEKLGKRYESLKGSDEAIQRRTTAMAGRRGAAQDRLQQLEGLERDAFGGAPPGGRPPGAPPTPPPGGGGGFAGMFRPGGPAMRIGGAALATIGAAGAVTDSVLTSAMMPQILQARRNQAMLPMLESIRQGDLVTSLAFARAAHRGSLHAAGAVSGPSALLGAPLKVVGGGIQGLIGKVTGGGGSGIEQAQAALFPQEIQTERFRQVLKTVETEREAVAARQQMAMRHFQEGMQGRIQARRLTGMQGLHLDPRTNKWRDPFGDLETALMKQGYSTELLTAAHVQARTMAGQKFARAFAGQIMGTTAAGYGGYADILAAGARRGGLGGAGLAQAALGGGIDTSAGIQLGHAVMGTGWDPRGYTPGAGTLAAIQRGFRFTGGPEDFNLVQRVGAGIRAGDALQTFDPYQQGRAILSAIQALPGASPMAQDLLAKMPLTELLEGARGELTPNLRAIGATPDVARRQLGGMATDLLQRVGTAADIGTDPISKAIRAFRGSGQQLPEFLAGLSLRPGGSEMADALGVYLGQEMGVGTEGGKGLIGLFTGAGKGLGGALAEGRAPMMGLTGVEKQYQEGLAEMQKQLNGILKAVGTEVSVAAQGLSTTFEGLGKATDVNAKIDEFVGGVEKATTALLGMVAKLEGKAPPRSSAEIRASAANAAADYIQSTQLKARESPTSAWNKK